MAADVVIDDAAESREVSGHGLKRRESFESAAVLALVVSGWHADAAVGTGRVDSAAIVFAEELAPLTTIENHRFAVLGDLLDHLVHAFSGAVAILSAVLQFEIAGPIRTNSQPALRLPE